jgi:hypothetical protein
VNLEFLNLSGNVQIPSLAPLSPLTKLGELNVQNTYASLSALHLATCTALRLISCSYGNYDLTDLEQLKIMLPLLRTTDMIELDSTDDNSGIHGGDDDDDDDSNEDSNDFDDDDDDNMMYNDL